MIFRKLMVIEISPLRIVFATDIDNREGGVVQIRLIRFSSLDRGVVDGDKKAAREELVFVRTAGVRQDFCELAHIQSRDKEAY